MDESKADTDVGIEDPDNNKEEKPEAKAKSAKSKLMIMIGAGVAAVLLVGAGAFFFVGGHGEEAEDGASQSTGHGGGHGGGHGEPKKAANAEMYYSITPPFIINFQTLGRIRYMQISVDVMTKDPRALRVMENDLPLIKNNLLALFDAQDFDVMATPQGRQALREAALEEMQKVMISKIGVPGIESVLFTSFILQ